MAVDSKALHSLAHAVRMGRSLEVNPEHGFRPEYEQSMRVYRYQWAVLSTDQKKEVIEAAESIADLTSEGVAAAVAALEA